MKYITNKLIRGFDRWQGFCDRHSALSEFTIAYLQKNPSGCLKATKRLMRQGNLEAVEFCKGSIMGMAALTKKWGDRDEWGWQRAAERVRELTEPINIDLSNGEDE